MIDLCSACRFSMKCMFRKGKLQAVNSCEEFETEEPNSTITGQSVNSEKDAKQVQDKVHKPASTAKLLGLCVNCINNNLCSFTKQEGGVWHCEEYV